MVTCSELWYRQVCNILSCLKFGALLVNQRPFISVNIRLQLWEYFLGSRNYLKFRDCTRVWTFTLSYLTKLFSNKHLKQNAFPREKTSSLSSSYETLSIKVNLTIYKDLYLPTWIQVYWVMIWKNNYSLLLFFCWLYYKYTRLSHYFHLMKSTIRSKTFHIVASPVNDCK